MPLRSIGGLLLAGFMLGNTVPAQAQRAQFWDTAQALGNIKHVVVIYDENHSFDNFFGTYPSANGVASAGAAATQVDLNGRPFAGLPPILNTNFRPAVIDTRFPANLPNAPFRIDQYVPQNLTIGDLVHRFYQEQAQIDGGRMDKFAAVSDAGGLVMGYYDNSVTALFNLAKEGVVSDNFFHAAFGGSFLNHAWLVCACAFVWPNAPASSVAVLDANGNLVKDGQVTPDGLAVNTARSVYLHAPSDTNPNLLVPPQTMPHIGDRLDAAGISWKWYSGGYTDAMAGKPDPLFQFHHQPLAYFADLAPGTAGQQAHLKDLPDLLSDIANNTLPTVAFYKPIGELNQHPGYADITSGDAHILDLVKRLRASPAWADMAIMITYDEHGGFWDHVAPPVVDRFGPGSRVPFILLSPFAKAGTVDHTQYDTTSILKFLEDRFNLPPLATRDQQVGNLRTMFR